MPKAQRILAAAMTAALVVFGLTSQTLHAQAPTVVMFYGGALKKPVLVTGADAASFNNLIARASVTVKELGGRPYLQVALFWASRSDPAKNGTPLSNLTPEMAWQHGRFYPPATGKPAILLTTELAKRAQPVPLPSNGAAFVRGGPVSESALAVLERLAIVAKPGPR